MAPTTDTLPERDLWIRDEPDLEGSRRYIADARHGGRARVTGFPDIIHPMRPSASSPRRRPDRPTPEATARFFSVLSDPTRLRIVMALLERERSVGELVGLVGAPQSRISNHLACLKWCRFAVSERRGRSVVYRIADPQVRGLIHAAQALAARDEEHLASCGRIGPSWI